MTNYIVHKKIESQLTGGSIIVSLNSFYSLPEAKKHFDRIKNLKKNVPYVFKNQKVTTELIVYDAGYPEMNSQINTSYFRKEVLEEHSWDWASNNSKHTFNPKRHGLKKGI